MGLKLSKCKQKEKSLGKEYKRLRFQLKAKLAEDTFETLMVKVNKTKATRRHSNRLKKLKKLRKLRCSTPSFESEFLTGEFFQRVEKEIKKSSRKKIKKEEIKKRRKMRTKLWRERIKERSKRRNEINDDENDTLDPLGEVPEGMEDWFHQFFHGVEAVKVKNLSDSPIPESIQAF